MTDEAFEALVAEVIDGLPQEFADKLENVAILIEAHPTTEQLSKLHMRPWTKLLGLYEGISLQGRAMHAGLLPDKITIFKWPILSMSQEPDVIKQNVRSVVLHEIAHHFGFTEKQLREIEHHHR